jgi:hypothetical protein
MGITDQKESGDNETVEISSTDPDNSADLH